VTVSEITSPSFVRQRITLLTFPSTVTVLTSPVWTEPFCVRRRSGSEACASSCLVRARAPNVPKVAQAMSKNVKISSSHPSESLRTI
jgi:hypothetical protein